MDESKSSPVLLAQISDLHIGGKEDGKDPLTRLEAVIEAIRSLPNRLDGVVVSGDLTDDGSEEGYRIARELLARLDVPIHVLPGNHDDRRRLRQVFDLPGVGDETIDYAVDVGELRLIALDSVVPGQDPGGFEPEQLQWLDDELLAARTRPTLLAMHHAPLTTAIREWDEINMPAAEREALAEVVAGHPQLRAIVGGHLHRIAASTLAGCPVVSAPSTYWQARPDFHTEDVELVDPPGFAIHALLDGELSSQVESIVL